MIYIRRHLNKGLIYRRESFGWGEVLVGGTPGAEALWWEYALLWRKSKKLVWQVRQNRRKSGQRKSGGIDWIVEVKESFEQRNDWSWHLLKPAMCGLMSVHTSSSVCGGVPRRNTPPIPADTPSTQILGSKGYFPNKTPELLTEVVISRIRAGKCKMGCFLVPEMKGSIWRKLSACWRGQVSTWRPTLRQFEQQNK